MSEPIAALAAERALVGCLLMEPRRAPEARSIVQPEHVYIRDVADVIALIYELSRSTPDLDAVIIEEHALRRGLAAAKTGQLHQWMRDAPATAAIDGYAREVMRAAVARAGREACLEAAEAYRTGDPAQVSRRLSDKLRDVRGVSSTGAHPVGSIGAEELQRIQDIAEGMTTPGVPWGLGPIDDQLGPLMTDDFVVLAGRPGMGTRDTPSCCVSQTIG